MLTILLDSISINAVYDEKRNFIEDLLSRDPSLFRITRTTCHVNQEKIREIPSIPEIEGKGFDQKKLNSIYENLSFHPKNPCQEQFFFLLLKYARQRNNLDYIYESVYVSENPIFYEKLLPGGTKVNCLKHFFPNLILVNLERLKDVLDYYEKKNEYYYFNHIKLNLKEEWYVRTLFSNFPELSNALTKYRQNVNIVKLLKSLGFRFRKLFYCINCIGIEHYFGNLRKDPIEPAVASKAVESLNEGKANISDLRGFIDPDNLFILFYHTEYLIALVTGVFDNLALLTKDRYQIILDKIKVSLSKDSGKEFLEKVEIFNPNLKQHINRYHDFINLIYEFREKVIHQEGLNQIVSPVVPNWSSFIKITPEINYYTKCCGDDKSEYKFISKWGVFEQESYLILDPYFFSKQLVYTLIKFANDYLQKLNYS
jgi:hypothetical protein